MGYGLANIDGRAAFIDGDDFYDVARLLRVASPVNPWHCVKRSNWGPLQTGLMLKRRMVNGETD